MKNLKTYLPRLVLILFSMAAAAQSATSHFADSIRNAYNIPELAYAVVDANSILDTGISGIQRAGSSYPAKPNDRFHIGSNTKAITSFIAALLVRDGKIKWNTKFFDLFPEMQKVSKGAYNNITLENLLTFRGRLPSYTYTNEKPVNSDFTGDLNQQRLQLAQYFLKQSPMKVQRTGLTPSNADYILAGLMLEKASGKDYKTLVTDFGKSLEIDFGFDYPNLTDNMQPWGHNANLQPIPPKGNYKLNWLLAAGNINVSLEGYIKFVQLLLRGLDGNSNLLTQAEFQNLLFGPEFFAFGWFNDPDPETFQETAYNDGNAGAFITQVKIFKESKRSIIIFTNAATPATEDGTAILMLKLQQLYIE